MALSDVARYLNSKLCVHQNEEIYHKEIYYPQTIVPAKIKAIIINTIKRNQANLLNCVAFCLSSIGFSIEKGTLFSFLFIFSPLFYNFCKHFLSFFYRTSCCWLQTYVTVYR